MWGAVDDTKAATSGMYCKNREHSVNNLRREMPAGAPQKGIDKPFHMWYNIILSKRKNKKQTRRARYALRSTAFFRAPAGFRLP